MVRGLSVIAISAVALVGCTTTEMANKKMATQFNGQSADSFFLRFGPPASSYKLNDGRTMYVWAEKNRSYNVGGSSSSTVNVVGNTAFVNTTSTPSSTIDVQCQVRILASTTGKIEQIMAQSDSIGMWEMSRCNEVFSKK